MALAYALLSNKSKETYVELLGALRDALIAEYGEVGTHKTFLVDFEIAAIQALGTVFPDSRVKGCSFHFRQAVYRRVQREGLPLRRRRQPCWSVDSPSSRHDGSADVCCSDRLVVAEDTARCGPTDRREDAQHGSVLREYLGQR